MVRNTISQSAQINGTRDQGICNSDPESELSLIGGPKVRDDGQAVFKAQFPDPGEQAEALLEICQGDLGEARGIAATNLKFAKCQGDKLYWWSVGVLISRQEPSVVMERLANSKLKRRTEIEVQLFKE